MLVLITVDRVFEPCLGWTKDYKIGICCFLSKHILLSRDANHPALALRFAKRDLIVKLLIYSKSQAILVSDWSISKKCSPLEPLVQMIRNLVGSIYGRSSIKITHSVRSVNKHGHHRRFLFLIGRFFSSPNPKDQVSYCHHWSSVRPSIHPSVNISHFNQLLWSHWAILNQTLVEWSLDGPLPKLCPVIPTSNQDGRQAKNRKKGGRILIVHTCFSISQNELPF